MPALFFRHLGEHVSGLCLDYHYISDRVFKIKGFALFAFELDHIAGIFTEECPLFFRAGVRSPDEIGQIPRLSIERPKWADPLPITLQDIPGFDCQASGDLYDAHSAQDISLSDQRSMKTRGRNE